MLAKGPLKPPSKPMTSSSSSQSSTARGELSFSVEPQRRKGCAPTSSSVSTMNLK
jgi:hypothetical protein